MDPSMLIDIPRILQVIPQRYTMNVDLDEFLYRVFFGAGTREKGAGGGTFQSHL